MNDDPEHQWIDRIRPTRASNQARQALFARLTGELQRLLGVKVPLVLTAAVHYQAMAVSAHGPPATFSFAAPRRRLWAATLWWVTVKFLTLRETQVRVTFLKTTPPNRTLRKLDS